MRWLALLTLLSATAIAQDSEIRQAAKSPITLARYFASHDRVDWSALWSALGVTQPQYWFPPCAASFAAGHRCSTQLDEISKPDQAILIIRGDALAVAAEYLRYLHNPKTGWQFAGEYLAVQRYGYRSESRIVHFGDKLFLKISSDHSQTGFATQQRGEDWFDLIQPGFTPVFSVTTSGSQSRFSMGVGRSLEATSAFSHQPGLETIQVTLDIIFEGPGLSQKNTYLGTYQRRINEKTFTLRRASPIPLEDFAELADPFSGISNEELLSYALPGLKKIATGTDPDAKEWLRSILDYAPNTPDKRALLKLLANP